MPVSMRSTYRKNAFATILHRRLSSGHSSSGGDIIDDEGCCLAKLILSNIVSFATRSRRKGDGNRENRGAIECAPENAARSGGGTRPAKASTTHKSPSDVGICDSIDEDMMTKLTVVPPNADRNEWLAMHVLGLFENVNALCGTFSELCTPISCSVMSYPDNPKAYWIDEKKKHHLYSAMQYIDCAMSYCENATKDEQIFPTKYGAPFPAEFEACCARIMRLLWHCCGHLYSNHWVEMDHLNLHAQCGIVMAHMKLVAQSYDLLGIKELESLSNTLKDVKPFVLRKCSKVHRDHISGVKNQHPFDSSNTNRCSKSGSWGGHSAPAVFVCKPYAHTC